MMGRCYQDSLEVVLLSLLLPKLRYMRTVSTISGGIPSFFWHAQKLHVLEETHPVYMSYLSNCITSYLEHTVSWQISCCHTVFPYYSLFWPMQVALSLGYIRRQSKHSYCPQSDKMLLIFNAYYLVLTE